MDKENCHNLLKIAGISILAFFALFVFYVFFIEPNMIVTTTVEIFDSQLASVLHDKKIIQISDLHLKKIGFRENYLISKINALHPDYVFITGDLFDEDVYDIDPFIEYLEKIANNHRIFAVPGNTDYFYSDFPDVVCKLNKLKGTRVNLLINENVRIEIMDRSFYIVGVDDPFLGFDNLKSGMEGVPENAHIILLAHSADVLEPRGSAISVRMSKFKGEKLSGWRWCDGDYSLQQQKVFYFSNKGLHRIRVQRGTHEVYVGKLILRKYTPTDFSPTEKPDQLGDIVLDIRNLEEDQIFGAWKKIKDDSLPWKFKMFDDEARHISEPYPLVSPKNYFDISFQAETGVLYKLWALLSTPNKKGHDKIWIQFNDSIDSIGNPIYQIGNYDPLYRLKDINLTLSGHTHGGQFRFPFQLLFVRLNRYGNKYFKGLYDTVAGHVYINRGIGTARFPLRFLAPPQITVISFGGGKQ